jgi:hypothetical protein
MTIPEILKEPAALHGSFSALSSLSTGFPLIPLAARAVLAEGSAL